jgi:hypothetical protein
MAEHPWGNSTLIGKCVICYDSYMIRYIIRYIISYMIPYMIRYNIPYTIPPPTVDSKRDLRRSAKHLSMSYCSVSIPLSLSTLP